MPRPRKPRSLSRPDNRSRQEINDAIRRELRASGLLGPDRFSVPILVTRQDRTKEDHNIASSYHFGDVVRYGRQNSKIGVLKGDYATVLDRDIERNTVSVQRHTDGSVISYDPSTLRDGQLFRTLDRSFAEGDRIQLTANWKQKGLANRQLGTIESMDAGCNVVVRMDGPRPPGSLADPKACAT